MKKIKVGDEFYLPTEKGWKPRKAIRLPDDPNPIWECERMIVKVYAVPKQKIAEQVFPVEPEWFYQRKLDFEETT